MSQPVTCTSAASDIRYAGIDVLRGLAILGVLAVHIPHYAHGGWREHPFYFLSVAADYGYLGVPLFVVIAGFCNHRKVVAGHMDTGVYAINRVAAWSRRLLRIYPSYLVAMGFSLLCAALVHQRYEFSGTFVADLGSHLLFLHTLTPDFGTGLANGALWFLGMIEQTFLLYLGGIWLLNRMGGKSVLLMAFLTTLLWWWIIPFFPEALRWKGTFLGFGSWHFWPFGYVFHWALGAWTVEIVLKNRTSPSWCRNPAVFLFSGFVGMVLNPRLHDWLNQIGMIEIQSSEPGFLLAGAHALSVVLLALSFAGLVLFVTLNPWGSTWAAGNWSRPARWLGGISYSIFLTHIPVLHCLDTWMAFDHLNWRHWPLRYLIYGSIMAAVGWLFHQGAEKRITRGVAQWLSGNGKMKQVPA